MSVHQVGDRARLGNSVSASGTSAFVPLGGSATDPTTVVLTIRKPSGAMLVYGYPDAGVSGVLTRESAGRFYRDVTFDAPGLWRCKLDGAGSVVGSTQWTETVERSVTV